MPLLQCFGCCFGEVKTVINGHEAAQERPIVGAVRELSLNIPGRLIPRQSALSLDEPASYRPEQGYEPHELIDFLSTRRYAQKDLNTLLNDLAFYLQDGTHPRPLRIAIFSTIAKNMADGQTIWIDDTARSREFFGHAAVDLMIEQLNDEPSRANREKLAHGLSDLLNEYAPSRQHWLIGGIQRSRVKLLDWVVELKGVNEQFAHDVEAGLRNMAAESVHNAAVRKHGALVFSAMQKSAGNCENVLFTQTTADILAHAKDHPRHDDIEEALNRLGLMIDPNPEVGLGDHNLPSVLNVLWTYIQRHSEPVVKAGLLEALQQRLLDIADEYPCSTGCFERLLDVPSGVDPSLSVFKKSAAVRDDVAKLASEINEEFATVFEGTELENEELWEFLDPEFVAGLKAGMLHEAAKQELKGIRGLAQSDIEKEVERMIPGFQ